MLVSVGIWGCSDVGLSVYFICHPASSLSQNKARRGLALPSPHSFLRQDETAFRQSAGCAGFALPISRLLLWSFPGVHSQLEFQPCSLVMKDLDYGVENQGSNPGAVFY